MNDVSGHTVSLFKLSADICTKPEIKNISKMMSLDLLLIGVNDNITASCLNKNLLAITSCFQDNVHKQYELLYHAVDNESVFLKCILYFYRNILNWRESPCKNNPGQYSFCCKAKNYIRPFSKEVIFPFSNFFILQYHIYRKNIEKHK